MTVPFMGDKHLDTQECSWNFVGFQVYYITKTHEQISERVGKKRMNDL